MKHETLSVDLNGNPFNFSIHLGFLHLKLDHKPLDCTVIKRLANSVIVEVADIPSVLAKCIYSTRTLTECPCTGQ